MHRKVTIGEGEHFRVDDVSNLAAFPQEGDELLTQDWLGTLRYRGLTVTKDGANAVVVAPGSAYVAFRQFALAEPVSVSLVDDKPLIAGQKRVVVLAAQGAGEGDAGESLYQAGNEAGLETVLALPPQIEGTGERIPM